MSPNAKGEQRLRFAPYRAHRESAAAAPPPNGAERRSDQLQGAAGRGGTAVRKERTPALICGIGVLKFLAAVLAPITPFNRHVSYSVFVRSRLAVVVLSSLPGASVYLSIVSGPQDHPQGFWLCSNTSSPRKYCGTTRIHAPPAAAVTPNSVGRMRATVNAR